METLTSEQAAKFLHCHYSTVVEKTHAGELPAKKIGRRWVFVLEHLADFISGRYTGSADCKISTEKKESWQSTKEVTRGGLVSQ